MPKRKKSTTTVEVHQN